MKTLIDPGCPVAKVFYRYAGISQNMAPQPEKKEKTRWITPEPPRLDTIYVNRKTYVESWFQR